MIIWRFLSTKEVKTMTINEYEEIISTLKGIIDGTEYEGHVFTVGGCERDRMLKRGIKDVDIVIDLPNGGIEFAEYLEKNGHTAGHVVTYPHYGTAMFRLKDIPDKEIEAVQTRKECYRDMETRNPETAFGTIMEDCMRRDFTINAIYRNVSTGETLDLTGKSETDMADRVIDTCADPNIIFREDPLRILRAIRFQSQLGGYGFQIRDRVQDGMYNNRHRLNIISQERITDEFNKMLLSQDPDKAFKILSAMDILDYVIPMDCFIGKFEGPSYFVERYMFYLDDDYMSLKMMPKNLEVRLAFLFRNFTNASVEKAMRIMKYSVSSIKEVLWYKDHDNLNNLTEDSLLRQTLYETKGNMDLFWNLLEMMRSKSDYRLPSSIDYWREWAFDEITKKVLYNESFKCMVNYKLPVDGFDVMNTLSSDGGPQIKRVFDHLIFLAFKDPMKMTKEFCIEEIEKYGKEHDLAQA